MNPNNTLAIPIPIYREMNTDRHRCSPSKNFGLRKHEIFHHKEHKEQEDFL